jgi:PAS domain S-box-containing protein
VAAVFSTAVLMVLRLGLDEAVGDHGPRLVFFFFSVTLSAWLGGLGPGLVATVLGTAIGWSGVLSPHPPSVLVVYFLVGLTIGLVCERMHRAVELVAAQAAALRASEERARHKRDELHAIYDAAPVGLCVLDAELRYVRINERLARLNGFAVPEHLGRTMGDLLPALHRQVEPVLRRVLERGEAVTDLEITGTLPDAPGVARTFQASYHPLRGVGGAIVGVNVVAAEITDRKQAAAEREQLLASERAARADAEHANRMKDDFLAVASHELRTPLNAVVGWASMLRRPGRTAAQLDKGLEVIDRNARLQAQLISDLLDVSRIVTGKIRVELQPVTLSAVVEAGVDALRAAAAAKGIEIETAVLPLEATVRADAARLQQIVTNLLSNAVKFTPRGGRVGVSLTQRGDRAELVVRDSGEGIAAAFLPHVFDRFRQADGSTTRQHGGLGLGLAIVKHLVELHGGEVRAESAGAGAGATFTVVLPCEGEDVARAAGPVFAGTRISLRGVSVLVIDDKEDARELVQRVLEEHEATVESASSATEALALLRRRAPHVLVSDISMPGMDGYELIRAVRRGDVAGAHRVPAMAVTAFAREEDRERALSAGYQAHLPKPIEAGALVAAVASLAAGGLP